MRIRGLFSRVAWVALLLLVPVAISGVPGVRGVSHGAPRQDLVGTELAGKLVIGFGQLDSPPYGISEGETLVGGIVKDIGDFIANEIGLTPVFTFVPRKRQDAFLEQGLIHGLALKNPKWIKNSEQYQWTLPLFTEEDVFLQRKDEAFPVRTIEDMYGKTFGGILGFHYLPLEAAIARGDIFREDVATFQQNAKKLQAGRIDALISSRIRIDYYLKQHNASEQFHIPAFKVSTHAVHDVFGRQLPVSFARLAAAYTKLVESGEMDRILSKYR